MALLVKGNCSCQVDLVYDQNDKLINLVITVIGPCVPVAVITDMNDQSIIFDGPLVTETRNTRSWNRFLVERGGSGKLLPDFDWTLDWQ